MSKPRQMTDDDIRELSFTIHEWFCNHPLGTTEEGYDHFDEFFDRLLSPFSNGYMNFN